MPGRNPGRHAAAVSADFHELRNQIAQLRRGGGSTATGGAALIYRPGGTTAGNVYATWSALYAVLSTVAGPRTVQIDDSIVSPAVIPVADTPYNLDSVSLTSNANFDNANGGAILQLADGVQLSFGLLTIGEWLLVQSMATAAPVVTVASGKECNVVLASFSGLQSTGAAAFFEVQTGGFLWFDLTNCAIGDDTHPVVRVEAVVSGKPGQANARESSLRANLFTGPGATDFDLFIDSGTLVGTPLGGPVAALTDAAILTAYAPASSTNWNNAPPSTVAAALDRIAAHIGPIP